MKNSTLRRISLASLSLLASFPLLAAPAKDEPKANDRPFNVFTMPQLHQTHAFYVSKFKEAISHSDYVTMKDICLAALQILPRDPVWNYNAACAFARLGYFPEAVDNLAEAVDFGFADTNLLATDSDIAPLRTDRRFAAILEKATLFAMHPERNPAVKKASPIGQTAIVSSANTEWNLETGGFITKFAVPDAGQTNRSAAIALPGPAGDLVRKWQEEGTAAGNFGDLYENRDRRHSVFDLKNFPDFKEIKFAQEATAAEAHAGASLFLYGGLPVIGNSSTALVDPVFWRSNARAAQFEFPHLMFLQYMNNQMYIYPQHEDYHAKKFGDVFAMRTPYSFISNGSSWTDKPIMTAIAAAMAALRPETKKALIESRQLAPTMQYIIRSSLKNLKKREDYLTPAAHPVVIDGKTIDLVKTVELAHSITTNCLPPFATFMPKYGLKRYRRDVDYFDDFGGEFLMVSPCASAFVWRGMDYSRHFVLDASASKDPCGNPITYHWFVAQGLEDKILISNESSDGSTVRVDIDYHDSPFQSPYKIKTSRVDIALVVDNGTHYSAPAFFSYFFPPNEKRMYFTDKAISSVDYASCATNYVDPRVSLPKYWCDIYTHNERGRITGWTRMRGKSSPVQYTPGGMRVLETGKDGTPTKTATPKYQPHSPAVSFIGDFEYFEVEE